MKVTHEIVGNLPVSWLVWHDHGNDDHTIKVQHLVRDGICKACPRKEFE